MSNYLHANLSEIDDDEFHQMIDELCHCAQMRRDDQVALTAFSLLSNILNNDSIRLTSNHLPVKGILSTKLSKLSQGAIYDFCFELATLKRTHIESFDNKTVLSLIKQCFPILKTARQKRPGRNESRHDRITNIILQRRANGDL